MKNKFTKRLLGFVMAFSIVFTPAVNAFANTPDVVTDGVEEQSIDSVLAVAEPVSATEMNGEIRKDILLESNAVSEIDTSVLDIETQIELQALGVPIDEVKKADIMQDKVKYTDEIYTKYIVDREHFVCVDEENNIKSIYNTDKSNFAPSWDLKFNTTEDDYLKTAEKTVEMLGLDSSYKLLVSEEDTVDYWFIAYRKVLDNGLYNENDGVNITIARKDASVAFLSTFDMPANTLVAEITKEEAITVAKVVADNLNASIDNKVELKYVRPNYYWKDDEAYETADFVRLAYEVSLNDGEYVVEIDAITGEVIGGGTMMDAAGSFGGSAHEQGDKKFLGQKWHIAD